MPAYKQVGGVPIGRSSGEKIKTYGEGRICAQPGCRTQLSRYNKGDWCSLHNNPQPGENRSIQARKLAQKHVRVRGKAV